MKWFKRVCVLLILAAVFFWGMLFTSENTAELPLHLVFWELPAASISLWVILSFAVGGMVGLVLSLALLARLRAGLLRAEHRSQRFEKEVISLRSNALKGN